MCIRVDAVEDIPHDLVAKIQRIRPDLMDNDCIDRIARRPDVLPLLAELNEYCISRGVVGIHCTRSFPDSILRNGLQPRSGQERREQFLREYGHLFTSTEFELIKTEYLEHFTAGINAARDNMVWFCLARESLRPGNIGRLLDYYGGEVVYQPIVRFPNICAKIGSIGEPLIVECRLHPDRIQGFWEYPVAVVWLSAYQVCINPAAGLYDIDVYSTVTIPPEDILSVCVAEYAPERHRYIGIKEYRTRRGEARTADTAALSADEQ